MPYHYSLPPEPNIPYIWPKGEHYYDHPDGQELFKKMRVCLRDSGSFGGFLGAFNAFAYLKTENVALGLFRTASFTLPFVLAWTSFPITVHNLVKIREKNDHYNYATAGAISGALWSAAFRHDFYRGLGRMVIFSAAAALFYEIRIVHNKILFPEEYYSAVMDYGSPSVKRWLDWGITRPRPQNWTRDPPPAEQSNQ